MFCVLMLLYIYKNKALQLFKYINIINFLQPWIKKDVNIITKYLNFTTL